MIINYHVNIGVAVAVEDGLWLLRVLPFTDGMDYSASNLEPAQETLPEEPKTKNYCYRTQGSTSPSSNLGMLLGNYRIQLHHQPTNFCHPFSRSNCRKTSGEKWTNRGRKHNDVIFGLRSQNYRTTVKPVAQFLQTLKQ